MTFSFEAVFGDWLRESRNYAGLDEVRPWIANVVLFLGMLAILVLSVLILGTGIKYLQSLRWRAPLLHLRAFVGTLITGLLLALLLTSINRRFLQIVRDIGAAFGERFTAQIFMTVVCSVVSLYSVCTIAGPRLWLQWLSLIIVLLCLAHMLGFTMAVLSPRAFSASHANFLLSYDRSILIVYLLVFAGISLLDFLQLSFVDKGSTLTMMEQEEEVEEEIEVEQQEGGEGKMELRERKIIN